MARVESPPWPISRRLGPPMRLDLSDGIGRKVVMEHEGPDFLAAQGFHPLLVLAGAEGQHPEDLGFAAGEKGAAVGPGQDADLAGNGPDLIELAAVDAAAFL